MSIKDRIKRLLKCNTTGRRVRYSKRNDTLLMGIVCEMVDQHKRTIQMRGNIDQVRREIEQYVDYIDIEYKNLYHSGVADLKIDVFSRHVLNYDALSLMLLGKKHKPIMIQGVDSAVYFIDREQSFSIANGRLFCGSESPYWADTNYHPLVIVSSEDLKYVQQNCYLISSMSERFGPCEACGTFRDKYGHMPVLYGITQDVDLTLYALSQMGTTRVLNTGEIL
jgi:hypothetical protein